MGNVLYISYKENQYIHIMFSTFFSENPAVYEIDIDIFINCSWVVTRWQYTFTHKQYIEQHK
jgi:hypothetical protein